MSDLVGNPEDRFSRVAAQILLWNYIFRRNILGYSDDDDLRNCRFTKHHPHGQFCPIFVLRDIVSYTGYNFEDLTVKVHVKMDFSIIIFWKSLFSFCGH